MENQATIIGKNTVISGNIKTGDSIVIEGGVDGNVESRGVLKLCGKIIGDVSAAAVHLTSAEVKGNILSDGEVTMDSNSLIIGDVTGKSAEISGSIKGNVDCEGFVRLTETAIVKGNVISSDNEKASGAIIEGQFIHSHDDLDVNEYFDTRSRQISFDDVSVPQYQSVAPADDTEDENAEIEGGGIMGLAEDFNEED